MNKQNNFDLKTREELIEEIEFLNSEIDKKDLVIGMLKITNEILINEE